MGSNVTPSGTGQPRDTRRLCLLCLALPQIWLWTMLRAIDHVAPASNLTFYLAEGVVLAALALALRSRRAPAGPQVPSRPQRVAIWAGALLMAACPALVLAGGALGLPALAIAAEVLGALCLVGCYATYVTLLSTLAPREAARWLLLSFATAPLPRLPGDLLPVEIAAPVAAVLPPLFVLALRAAAHAIPRDEARASQPQPEGSAPEGREGDGVHHLVPLLVELAAFGLAMGLFRSDAAGIHDSLWFVLLNCALKTAVPLLILLALERLWQRVSVAALCQATLAALTILMVVAVNLAGVPFAPFVAFDLARYVMVIVMLLALPSLARQIGRHPAATLGLGMGAYTLALSAGIATSSALASASPDPSVLVLDVVCVLVLCTVLSSGAGRAEDLRLFSDGSPELAPAQPPDEIDARCEKVARTCGLSERELETMKLICRGRSKRYIAEQMALSENTVRGYAKTLYAKLDVHSRQDLMSLVGID